MLTSLPFFLFPFSQSPSLLPYRLPFTLPIFSTCYLPFAIHHCYLLPAVPPHACYTKPPMPTCSFPPPPQFQRSVHIAMESPGRHTPSKRRREWDHGSHGHTRSRSRS